MNNDLKIVVIGGGTGSIALLEGLKARTNNITAIVNMADDGGSTGVLRDELGVLPAGDAWKCLAALSDSQKLKDLFGYRFNEGTLKGHSLGNILMAACEKMTGNFDEAVTMVAEILHIQGRVIPATLADVRLKMEWPDNDISLVGEHIIDVEKFTQDPRHSVLSLTPEARANPAAVTAINEADIVVIAPGDLYTSLGPQLVLADIAAALRETSAVKVYVSNLVTKPGHTDSFTVGDHANEIERFVGSEFLDYVLYNQQAPDEQALAQYEQQGVRIVPPDTEQLQSKHYKAIPGEFLGAMVGKEESETFSVAARSLIRHDPVAVASAIMSLYDAEH